MSEINSITTSSNKFLYNQSELITPVDTSSFFGSARQVIHYSIVKSAANGKVLYVYAVDSNNQNYTLTGYLHALSLRLYSQRYFCI